MVNNRRWVITAYCHLYSLLTGRTYNPWCVNFFGIKGGQLWHISTDEFTFCVEFLGLRYGIEYMKPRLLLHYHLLVCRGCCH